MEFLVAFGTTHPNIAYLYALIGNVSHAFIQILFKKAEAYLSTFQLIFFRSLLLLAFNSYMLHRQSQPPYIKSRETLRLVIIRMAYMCLGTITMFYCLKYLPVSTVSTLYNTGPIFVFFLQKLKYNKPLNMTNLTLTILSFGGVILIIRPSFLFGRTETGQSVNHYGLLVILMLIAAFGNAMNKLYIHLLSKKVSASVNIQYSHLGFLFMGGTLINFESTQIYWQTMSIKVLFFVLSIAVVGLLSQYFIFASNTLKKPSLMMPFGYASVVTAYLADLFLFNGKFKILSCIGILMTSSGLFSEFLLSRKSPRQNKLMQNKECCAQVATAVDNQQIRKQKMAVDSSK